MAIGKDMVTVVVPIFNEEEAIGLVLDELFEAGYRDVLVVDGSADGTTKAAGCGSSLTFLFGFRHTHN